MAKSKGKIKKDSNNSKKVKEVKVGRGRPKKSDKAVAKKVKPVKVAKPVKVEKKKEVKVKEVKKEIKPSETPKQPKLSENDLLLQNIYGDELVKDAIPLPVTEQKTQTTTIISEYNIDIQRLPKEILDSVNDLTGIFNTILQNPLLASNYINEFLEKDTKSFNAIKEWIEPRKDSLLAYKVKTKGGVSVTQNVSTKVVVNAENINTVKNNIPAPIVQNTAQPQVTHGQNPIVPRENSGGTYQHHIHSNPVHNNPASNIENKNIHHEMLSKNNHFADVHLQQNPSQHIEQPVVVSSAQYIRDYTNGIMDTINATFQMQHWKYIPLDALTSILNGLDKSFGYEVTQDGENSYINISKGGDMVTTPKFNIQN